MKTTNNRRRGCVKLTPKFAVNETRIDRIFTVTKRSATRNDDFKEAIKKSKFGSPLESSTKILGSPTLTSPLKRLTDLLSPQKTIKVLISPPPSGFVTPAKSKKEIYEEQTRTPLSSCKKPQEFSKAEWLSPRVQASANFELPLKYSRLLDLFENMERVVSIEHRQEKRIMFESVQQNVKNNLKKDFTKSHFAQMLHIYPNSYNFRLERPVVANLFTPSNKLKLVIEPNLLEDLIPHWHEKSPQKPLTQPEYVLPLGMISPIKKPKGICDYHPPPSPLKSPMKTPSRATPKKTIAVLDLRPKLEPWRLHCRKMIFRYKLMKRVKDAHDEFLKSIETPEHARTKARRSIDSGNSHGFHPDFDPQAIEDVPEAELPEPPKEKSTPSSVKKFLASVETTPSTPKFTRSDEIMIKSTARRQITFEDDTPTTPTRSKLLERIQAKEQEAKLATMFIDKDAIDRQNRLEFIKSKLLGVICSEYALRKKNSMEFSDLVNRLQISQNMSQAELREHIKLLTEVANDFISCITWKQTTFIRLEKNDYDQILAHINANS